MDLPTRRRLGPNVRRETYKQPVELWNRFEKPSEKRALGTYSLASGTRDLRAASAPFRGSPILNSLKIVEVPRNSMGRKTVSISTLFGQN